MTDSASRLKPVIIVIFGITGDLSRRKLIPALYDLFASQLIHPHSIIVGVSRRTVRQTDIAATIDDSVSTAVAKPDVEAVARLQKAVRMHKMDLTQTTEYTTLKTMLDNLKPNDAVAMDRLYYLSIPPGSYREVIENLGKTGHATGGMHDKKQPRLLVEKPFGHDLVSAQQLLLDTSQYFEEPQTFRIDHYAARPEMNDFLAFRRQPGVDSIWNGELISSVTITAFEEIGIEGRAEFYDQVGALRDFIQSHLLQVLAFVLMDLPVKYDSDSLHNARHQALSALHRITTNEVQTTTVRGQYQGYLDEVHDAASHTETYAEINTFSADPRWTDVKCILRTGKAMNQKRTDIYLKLRFGGSLMFSIVPDTGFSLTFPDTTAPDSATDSEAHRVDETAAGSNVSVLQRSELATQNARLDDVSDETRLSPKRLEAYARVFLDAINGDHTVFSSQLEVLDTWRIIDDVVQSWAADNDLMRTYPKNAQEVR